MRQQLHVGEITIGDGPLAVIAGPCVLESVDQAIESAAFLRDTCRDANLPFIFKASYDKANRTSTHSPRGPGLAEGLAMLAAIKDATGVPLTTDVHECSQAGPVAEIADLLQVPAFLCRQTDLLVACARTGRPVNVKKGQFMSPHDMTHVTAKLEEAGCSGTMLTERGTFFGYQRLVNDFIGLGDLMELGPPVCFDVTHSTQLPGGGHDKTAGRPDRAGLLCAAAAAAGVDAIFIECHQDPPSALSDASTMQPLQAVPDMVHRAAAIAEIVRSGATIDNPPA
jgi:2-dehydro-3-deoxyphosphooctonate aldolase (KDO 8-P synthase)